MIELFTGAGLATSAGLNAYIPLLVLGLTGRYADFVQLPVAAQWLTDGWVLGVLGVLLTVEIVADKVPVLDSVNDAVQNIVRPTSGGISFGTGAASETAAVADPSGFFSSHGWVSVTIGVVLALVVSLGKTLARPVIDLFTGGVGAPVVSTVEDLGSTGLAIAAILVPILAALAVLVLLYSGFRAGLWWSRRRAAEARPGPDAAR
jgi:hypothetical protein